MVDRFIERVASLSGRTVKVLERVSDELRQAGFVTQVELLKVISDAHRRLARACISETQPIEIERYDLTERLKKIIDESRDVAADMISRRRPGHSEVSDAADLIQKVLDEEGK